MTRAGGKRRKHGQGTGQRRGSKVIVSWWCEISGVRQLSPDGGTARQLFAHSRRLIPQIVDVMNGQNA
eukprot:7218494-Alexandrium_andersonii.AAC.1